MRAKKAETDQLFHLYQTEKDKKRKDDALALSELHLKQAVGYSNNFYDNHSSIFLARPKGSRA